MTRENPQHVSVDGAKFVAVREALVTQSYFDGVHKWGPRKGETKWSIGFGSQTPEPKEGDTITIEESFNRLREDIRTREVVLNNLLTVVVTQPMFDMLFSLFYQAGTQATRAVTDLLNAGVPEPLAAIEFANWNSGEDRKPTPGHSRRRIMEMYTAVTGDYGDISQVKVFRGNPREVPYEWMPLEMEDENPQIVGRDTVEEAPDLAIEDENGKEN